ncbi:MAG: HAD family hydrolase [Mycobacteriales bacterium]
MNNRRPQVISVDVGGTLGYGKGPGLTSTLEQYSPLPAVQVRTIIREHLHTAPELTEQVVVEVCAMLDIPTRLFPYELAGSALHLFPDAIPVLKALGNLAPVVTLSNVTRMELDTNLTCPELSPWVVDQFPSCGTGYAKPDRRAFEIVGLQFGVDMSNTVHIGDSWECDVLGALTVGATAIWLSGGRPVPASHGIDISGVLVARDLNEVVTYIQHLCTGRNL